MRLLDRLLSRFGWHRFDDPRFVVPDLSPLPPQHAPADRTRDYRRTFGTPEGKRVLWHILAVSGIGQPVFRDGDDALAAARRDGARELAQRILIEISRPIEGQFPAEATNE